MQTLTKIPHFKKFTNIQQMVFNNVMYWSNYKLFSNMLQKIY
jgi:hypothetical protein